MPASKYIQLVKLRNLQPRGKLKALDFTTNCHIYPNFVSNLRSKKTNEDTLRARV